MYLVQILLPLSRSTEAKIGFEGVLGRLTHQFGGATAYLNSPAQGLWNDGDDIKRDRVVTVEVMLDAFNPSWWSSYRTELERDFSQEEIVIRRIEIERV